jgi:hypothetical protein
MTFAKARSAFIAKIAPHLSGCTKRTPFWIMLAQRNRRMVLALI